MTRKKDEAEAAARMITVGTKTAEVVIRRDGPEGPEPEAEDERRRQPRYTLNLTVALFGDNNFYLGVSENISEGGLFVRTHNVLAAGTRIKLEFTLPTSNKPVSTLGVVRWVRSPDAVRKEFNNFGSVDDVDSKPGMGIEFEGLASEAAEAISKFIRYRKPEFYEG
jgi:uncharacterized protein (TIGR02266 family)